MSRSERYLPFVIALLAPAAGAIQNDVFAQGVPLEVILTFYFQIFLVLLILWYYNKFLLLKSAKLSKKKKNGVLVFANLFIVLLLSFLSQYNNQGLEGITQPFWMSAARLTFVILIFNVILRVFESQREKAELAYQNLSLQAENLKFQVDTLKQQINPHFLFNSLNTLLDLVEDQRENAVEFIRNFSNLYRVVLQSAKFDFIPLEDELQFLSNYWNLLQVRFGEAIELNVDVPIEKEGIMIPPLSLQLLIENAVKHNEATKSDPLKIDVELTDEFITVSNRLKPKRFPVASEKVGLKNLQQRFTLLYKPIEWSMVNDQFIVNLPLKKAG